MMVSSDELSCCLLQMNEKQFVDLRNQKNYLWLALEHIYVTYQRLYAPLYSIFC